MVAKQASARWRGDGWGLCLRTNSVSTLGPEPQSSDRRVVAVALVNGSISLARGSGLGARGRAPHLSAMVG
jgi:hypothetical protein